MAKADFYRVLQVAPHATMADIKTNYRRLVLQLHPDRLKHVPEAERLLKTVEFKKVTEAYAVLSDTTQRHAYDREHAHERRYGPHTTGGSSTNGFRSAPPRTDYRKVYRPYTPPNFQTWDHERHYDMHYGDGMQREAVDQAFRRAELEESLRYQSPLGKGFTFGDDHEHVNPYAKYAPQGPPKVVVEYEESLTHEGKEHLKKTTRIVKDMYGKRDERREKAASQQGSRRQRTNAAFASQPNEDCVLL
jgi:curved DNA-binding protein CbpA